MAHPKHKVSSTRRDKRRTHYKAAVPTVVTCSNCGAATCCITAYAPSAASIAESSPSRRRLPNNSAPGQRGASPARRALFSIYESPSRPCPNPAGDPMFSGTGGGKRRISTKSHEYDKDRCRCHGRRLCPRSGCQGAVMALDAIGSESRIVLFGDEEKIRPSWLEGCPAERFDIVATPEVIEMGDHPAKAFQAKADSSITVGFGYLAKGADRRFCKRRLHGRHDGRFDVCRQTDRGCDPSHDLHPSYPPDAGRPARCWTWG